MRLYVQEKNSLLKFNLPAKVDGSMLFSFQSTNGIENSLNIDAVDGKWILNSNGNINIIGANNSFLEKVALSDYMCIPVSITGISDYICIFCLPSTEECYYNYPIGNLTNITIGKSSDNNIVYQQNMMADHHAVIRFENNSWFLYPVSLDSKICIYVNNQRVLKATPIFAGDIIFMNGLRIVWMKKAFIIPMASELYSVNNIVPTNSDTFVNNTKFTPVSELEEGVVLFGENECFVHTPRIKSVLEKEEVKVDAPPPKIDTNSSTPFLMSIGASITVLGMMFTNGFALYNGLVTGENDIVDFLPQIIMIVTMLISSIFIPSITKKIAEKELKHKEKVRQDKYSKYLLKKEQEIASKVKKQEHILLDNYVDFNACLTAIQKRTNLLWNKIIKDDDFLEVRIGLGSRPSLLELVVPEEKFSLDDDELYDSVVSLGKKYSSLNNVPITVDLKDQVVTSFILQNTYKNEFINGVLLQLLTFYSPLDLKIVVFTDNIHSYRWNYLKYTNHNWNDDFSVRFFATNISEYKKLCQELNTEFSTRFEKYKDKQKEISEKGTEDGKTESYALYDTYYLVITDCFREIQSFKFIEELLDNNRNFGFSMAIFDNDMKNVPNECNKFLFITDGESGMLNSIVSESNTVKYKAEYIPGLNMRQVARLIGNVPIKSQNEESQLPTALSFLQMYNVGKIEQLNIRNRWLTSDPMSTLAAPIGVHSNGELFYLDLHEKNDGPHGLIAGSTGSGKSEFIITYLLSMALNYDPKEVQFVLIDYKGGGLTGAFENRELGISVPHLAGTITNLDVSEMNRTLVSIESELKRRQHQFNVVKEKTGESTMDIYKYQRLYREGVIDEPVSHLIIVSDEFAELKAQQPDFMDQLVSTARIGRSLGVHLILATQKPSGVVNDQIWSNSKFKVCLKVATVEDSKEMLKRPEAASIKEAGRFYLQVGYDEYFDIGQSAWAGEKYVPTERIMKKKDNNIRIVNNCGNVIKSISSTKVETKKNVDNGDQLTNIVKYLYNLSKEDGFEIKKLWLPSLKEVILCDDLVNRYSFKKNQDTMFDVVLGEYDAPSLQKQGPLVYNYLKNGNTAIVSTDGRERESMIKALVYNTAKYYSAKEVNFYFIDYGSESFRMYQKLPHVGGMIFTDEIDKFESFSRLIQNEIVNRKKMLVNYGGEYSNYIKAHPGELPIWVVVFNNYEAFSESYSNIFDLMPKLIRDSERYGIIFMFTLGSVSSIGSKLGQYVKNNYAFKLKETLDYSILFDIRSRTVPKAVFGRGIYNLNNMLTEFQIGSICPDESQLTDFVLKFVNEQIKVNTSKAKPIPTLPDFVRLDNIKDEITSLDAVPVGINKQDFSFLKYNFLNDKFMLISSKKVSNAKNFVVSLLSVFAAIPSTNLVIVDGYKNLNLNSDSFRNYFCDNFPVVFNKINDYVDNFKNNNSVNNIIVFYGFSRFYDLLEDSSLFQNFAEKIRTLDNFRVIIIDDVNKLKQYSYEAWFSTMLNLENGIWVGTGISDQNLYKISGSFYNLPSIPNDMGYLIVDGELVHGRLLDFFTKENE